MKIFLILFLLATSLAEAKTYFIDPLANLVYYDVTTDRTNLLFEKNAYNHELIKRLSKEKVHVFNEFSGLGSLDLSNLPNAQYHQPNSYIIEPLILHFNEWGFIKTDDFFMSLDSILFSAFTFHPFSKRSEIKKVISKIPKEEEIEVITTTWNSGEALYKSLLKEYKNVTYTVRDLKLNKTLFPTKNHYPLISNEVQTQYIIFDSPSCFGIFNLKSQAQLASSHETFKKKQIYHEGNPRESAIVNQRIAQYLKENCPTR